MSNTSFKALIKNHWKSLIAFSLLVLTIQVLNSAATFPSVLEWYPTLNRPSWTPPNWVFGPVWTILYIFIAISGWLLWNNTAGKAADKIKNPAIAFYFAQLVFNTLWSYLFFKLQNPVYGLICIIFLALSAFMTLYFSHKYRHKAVAMMFIPYCLWLSYALQLNAAIVMMN